MLSIIHDHTSELVSIPRAESIAYELAKLNGPTGKVCLNLKFEVNSQLECDLQLSLNVSSNVSKENSDITQLQHGNVPIHVPHCTT